jgi:hypothetical protein
MSESSNELSTNAAISPDVSGEQTSAGARRGMNTVTIEVKTHFELDDSQIFNLNGDGIKITMVTEN